MKRLFFFLIIIPHLFFSVVFAASPETTAEYLRQYGSDPWAVMARVARGEEGGAVIVDTTSVFSLAKSILALAATGGDPNNAVQTFLQTFIRDGQIGDPAFLNDDFWGVLALRAGGVSAMHPAVADALTLILRSQDANGGWSWSAMDAISDTDDTAAAVMALLEAGVSANDPVIIRALAFLQSKENADGGFPNIPGGPSSLDSTAWVAMALRKAGKDMPRAQHFLQSTMRDDGSWGSSATTSFAAIALSGKWFPVTQDFAGTTARGSAASHPVLTASPSAAGARAGLSLRVAPRDDAQPYTSFIFPSLIAQSVFSKPERTTVVQVAIDSDGDGYSDDVERMHGYDPHDARPVKKSNVDKIRKAHKVVKSKVTLSARAAKIKIRR